MTLGQTLPFGLRDLNLTPLGADGKTVGTATDLPVARTLSFSETEDFTELDGDDVPQGEHGAGPVVEFSIEAGGISLEAYAVFAGGTVTLTGVSPNQKKVYRKLATDSRPYFKVEGQSISDSGGDFHGLIYCCKMDGSIEGSMEYGAFWMTSGSGKGYASKETIGLGRLYDFVQNETQAAIVGGATTS